MLGRRVAPPAVPIILDTGGVLAYLAGKRDVRELCLEAFHARLPLILPTVVYAQVERGWSRRNPLTQQLPNLLHMSEITTLSLEVARQAGWLLRDSGTTDVVDAVVVVEALQRDGSVILTSDRGDMSLLLGFTANRQRRGVRVVGV
jgi:PIN domain